MIIDLAKPVMTRDGRKVELITTSGREPYPLIGYIDNGTCAIMWKRDGRRVSSHETYVDLINVPEPKRVVDFWVTFDRVGGAWMHSSRKEAEDYTSAAISHIRWTEGKGAEVIND